VSRSRRVLLVSAATLLPVLAGLAQPAAAAPGDPAPFAPNTAGLHWSTQSVAPGVTVVSGSLTGRPAPSWTVTVDETVTSKLTGQPAPAELGSPQWAQSTVE